MKSPKDKLLESIGKILDEVIKEAGPVGYLSKTKRPDAKTSWDPNAQDKWAKEKETQMGLTGMSSASGNQASNPQQKATQGTQGTQGTTQTSIPPENSPEKNDFTDPEYIDKDYNFKTNIGGPAAQRKATRSIKPAGQSAQPQQTSPSPTNSPSSLADVSSMLQSANEQQLAQILRILKGN